MSYIFTQYLEVVYEFDRYLLTIYHYKELIEEFTCAWLNMLGRIIMIIMSSDLEREKTSTKQALYSVD